MLKKFLKNPQALFIFIVMAYSVYAGAFIFRTSAVVEQSSFVPETKRYFVLFDDMMISMRYAKNFAVGHGPVWYPGGERVEGYTNPLWVLYMAFWHWTGIAGTAKISLIIQLSGAVCLMLNLFVVKRITEQIMPQPLAMLGAVLFTASYLPLNMWSLHGTEVGALTLIVGLATWWTLRALQTEQFIIAPYVLLGLSTGIRMDMAVPLGALAVFLCFNDRPHRRQHLIMPPLILALCLAPQFLFRYWYYDDWLPNTYYLKMTGYPLVLRLTQGYEVTGRFFMKVGVLPFAIFIFRRDRRVRLLAWLLVAQVLYNCYVGGDAWEWYGGANRYVSLGMPLYFILLWCVLVTLYTRLLETAALLGSAHPHFRLHLGAARIGLALTGLVLLLNLNYTYGTDALKEWLLVKPSMFASENNSKVQQAFLLEALTHEDATIAISGAGIVPYFADRPFIDLLGKNDKVIGRGSMVRGVIPEFLPGHMKWDYGYSIGVLQPDVVLELWMRPQDAGPYLDADYHRIWFPPAGHDVWMRKDSPRIWWERIWGDGS